MKADRKFTGVWISKEIMENETLNAIDKMLYAEIECFDDQGKGSCWASNKYLAELLGVSIPTITRSIKKLKTAKLIEEMGFNGRNRVIKLMRQGNQFVIEPNQIDEAPLYKRDNSIENRIVDSDHSFDQWYKEYPKHVGKGQAEKAFKVAIRSVEWPLLIEKTMLYFKSVCGIDRQYIKNPATWLNGKCWLDEYKNRNSEPERIGVYA